VPPKSHSSVAANEAAAISTLRSIAVGEAQIRARGVIDTNGDGVGEYGYLAELAGTKARRVSAQGVPAAGSNFTDRIERPVLRGTLGKLDFSSAEFAGYRFELWLPGPTINHAVEGVREDNTGGKLAAPFPNPRNGAGFWCCYAWPVRVGETGKRAFFVNQEGLILDSANDSATPLSGVEFVPWYGEAFIDPLDMSSALRIGPPAGGAYQTIWTPVWQ
jgi:hypothetical protein